MNGASTRSRVYVDVMRTASRLGRAFLMLACICTATSCISQEQKHAVLSWYDTSEAATKLQKSSPTATMRSSDVEQRIGKPDKRVPAASLPSVLPGRWGSDEIREAIDQRSRQLVHSGLDAAVVANEINSSEFWLYDESARYRSPSQPDSFWGMGTGFQVVWFAVYKDQVVASDGFGLRKTRRITKR